MTPDRFNQIKTIFDLASQLPPNARSEWLDHACGGDAELRREVESLLAAHDASGSRAIGRAQPAHGAVVSGSTDFERQIRTALESALGKQYEVLRLLGRGGMGAVYLARDVALDVRVAIKTLRPELTSSDESRQRFRREARIAARLRHPNIVRLHHYLESDDLWCFVMDYVPGGTLSKRLSLEGRVLCDETRTILAQLADALDYAHAHGVVHRDIKPGNIIFDAERKPMLADFGIAQVGDANTITPPNESRGTPAYMSPEQLKAEGDVDGRSDIYSLGLVGYAMLVGKEPYSGMSVGEVMSRKLVEDPVPIAQVAPTVTEGLEGVITRSLARDRAQRFPDARSLKEALEHADCQPAELHHALVEMPGFGHWALVWATFWSTYAFLGNHGQRETILTLIVAGLVPLGFALQVWNLGQHPFRLSELVRVSYWPPVWWGMWWPLPLRRPTDLWIRLPWPARGVRIALSIFFVGMPALVMVQSMLAAPSPGVAAAAYALLIATGLATAAGILWSRYRHVPSREITRILFGATLQSGIWRSPTLARLLAPPRGVRPPEHDDPRDYGRAINEIVALLPRDISALGRESAALARRLLGVIQRFDREIAALGRDASPAAIEKLTTDLIALGPRSETEPGHRRALRDAISNQLVVLRSMQRDAQLAEDDREEVFDLLRSAWAHLRRLHEDATTGEGDTSGAADALKVLGTEIERRLLLWVEEPDPDDDGGGASATAAVTAPRVPPPFGVPHIQGSSPLGP